MTQPISGISQTGFSTRQISALAAIALGVLLIAATGFAGPHALHEGTHDTRHAFGLPCH